ncbi:MAG: NRDE family protein [Betaproteobacteria bacterium]
MCLVVLALGLHADYPVILGANRDEFHQRPTASACLWPDAPDVAGGRDLQQGGAWLAASRRGALAVVTNYRDPANRVSGGPSRGQLVKDFVAGPPIPAETFLRGSVMPAEGYDGFNLIAVDASGAWYGSNRGTIRPLSEGLYGLSNHLLDTPWPKVLRVKAAVGAALSRNGTDMVEGILDILGDREGAPDDQLPSTGVSLELERLLAAPFIVSPEYGTRCSTVVTVDRQARLKLVERSFGAAGSALETRVIDLSLQAPLHPNRGDHGA